MNTQITTFEEYFLQFEKSIQAILQKTRKTIQQAAPQAIEVIKYGMPTFYQEGNLVHFAANKKHLGFYPSPSGLKAFETEVNKYNNSKGAVQFPYNQPIPYHLIAQITQFRVDENLQIAQLKKQLRKCKNGHKFYKTSDCPTCPICEKNRVPTADFLSKLSAPAQRALENYGITTLQKLSEFSEKEILKLHGLGKTAIPILQNELQKINLKFKPN